jgi:hypothetical protein
MNHPTKEEWMSFLYDELPDEKRIELRAHLKTCASCESQVARWQKMKLELGAWKLAATARKPQVVAPNAVKWAAAAVLMLGLGFGFGRFSAPPPDLQKLQASVESQLRQRLQQELATVRTADRKEVIAMLRDIEEQRISDYTQLRQDLETVAVLADEKLSRTERALKQASLFAQTPVNNQQQVK